MKMSTQAAHFETVPGELYKTSHSISHRLKCSHTFTLSVSVVPGIYGENSWLDSLFFLLSKCGNHLKYFTPIFLSYVSFMYFLHIFPSSVVKARQVCGKRSGNGGLFGLFGLLLINLASFLENVLLLVHYWKYKNYDS